jgi:acid phosphatase family membrane protein YuiD
METLPLAFTAAAAAMAISQGFKIFSPLLHGKAPAFRKALQSGGMPSAHTAAAVSLTLVTGFREGFNSSVFAVALVLTAVIAHDAVKVRGSINTIIRILKRISPQEVLDQEGTLPDTVGHTVQEVGAGFLLAIAVAAVFRIFLI